MVPVQKTNHPVQRLQKITTSFPLKPFSNILFRHEKNNEELIKKPGGDWLRDGRALAALPKEPGSSTSTTHMALTTVCTPF